MAPAWLRDWPVGGHRPKQLKSSVSIIPFFTLNHCSLKRLFLGKTCSIVDFPRRLNNVESGFVDDVMFPGPRLPIFVRCPESLDMRATLSKGALQSFYTCYNDYRSSCASRGEWMSVLLNFVNTGYYPPKDLWNTKKPSNKRKDSKGVSINTHSIATCA